MKSIWNEDIEIKNFDKLHADIKTDVLIIGGGMAGILCAYFLNQKGVNNVLVEADKIGRGITQNTTAKLTAQHGLIYDKLLRNASYVKAKQYLEANLNALQSFKLICQDINCDYEEKDSYVYTLDDSYKIEKEIRALEKLNYNAKFEQNLPLPFHVAGAIKFNNQAQFHPLKFISGICNNLNIYENTFVRSIDGNIAITKSGRIKAKNIIIATHFPFINTKGMYFIKMYQNRSYVIALENAVDLSGMYVDEKENGLSFRNYGNMLFIGGGDHRTGKNGGKFRELRNYIKEYYPNSNEKYLWATQDCMTLDHVPYIGRYSKYSANLYVATGLNKWGMTSSMISAKILTDTIVGEKNDFANVFSPHRNWLKPQLLVNGAEAVVNLLAPSTKRCSHLGCTLKWNKTERTWDCPCHGSRFNKNGSIINNPAMKRIKP